MTNITITALPPQPLHAMEIWSNPASVAKRFHKAMGFPLPPIGCSQGNAATTLIRYEPTVWLVEGDINPLASIMGDDGALTAIDGGVKRIKLAGPSWRELLMEGGVFNAENPAFASGCSAATIIQHVGVRLHVLDENACLAYVPSSYAHALTAFWQEAARHI